MENFKTKEFENLIGSHKGILISVSRNYSYCEEEQKDLFQEIMLQAWRSFATYNSDFKFSTWLYRVSLNVAISYVRKKTSEQRKLAAFEKEPVIATENNEPIEQFIQLERLLKKLCPLDRALILMQLDGLEHGAIADVMHISKSNVSTRLVRIKEQLVLMNKRK